MHTDKIDKNHWRSIAWLALTYVICTALSATVAQLGLFNSIASDYISGDALNWIELRKLSPSYLDLDTGFLNLNNVYLEILDGISPVMVSAMNVTATVVAIMILGRCGATLSGKAAKIAAASIALNPFFWMVALGPTKEPFTVCTAAASLAVILKIKLPWQVWALFGIVLIASLFLRLEVTLAIVLATAAIAAMRKLGFEKMTTVTCPQFAIYGWAASISASLIVITVIAPLCGLFVAGALWLGITCLILATWLRKKDAESRQTGPTQFFPTTKDTTLNVKFTLLAALTSLLIVPTILSSEIKLPNGRTGLVSEAYYDHFESLQPSELGATSLSVSRKLSTSELLAPFGAIYRLAGSILHAPLRPIFATTDGRASLYMTAQWLNEFFVTFGMPAAMLILIMRKDRPEQARCIAALACALAVAVSCYPKIHVRYFIPLIPYFVMLLFMLTKRERQILALGIISLAIIGPLTLFLAGFPPPESSGVDFTPGHNPYIPSWLDNERPPGS